VRPGSQIYWWRDSMQMIEKLRTVGSEWSRKAISVLLLCMCCLASGCKRTQTIWSAEARSPDGKMIATARAYANGGFGVSGSPATFVYLNWTAGSQSPTEILSLDDQSDRTEENEVGMTWLASNRLELTFTGKRQSIGFQAVKCYGVDISVRDISSTTSRGNTP
jgi:hypothetical protein